MDQKTPNIEEDLDIKQSKSSLSNVSSSLFFKNYICSNLFIEAFNKSKDRINLIFRHPQYVNSKKEINIEKIREVKEIKLIIDFQCLSKELSLEKLKELIYSFIIISKENSNNYFPKLSLVIENTLINEFSSLVDPNNKLILNELRLSDELYNISPNLNKIFPQIQVNKLVLKKFKINSRLQLSNFCKFIIDSECKELILEDIFIELIIKKNEKDIEYNQINYYFTYTDGVISLGDQYTHIHSLKLRDCPLFVITENMFTLIKEIEPRIIDIDESSLINPSIITKFKINEKKFDICFDLDSYKVKKEENEENEEDPLDYFEYIFNIIIGFSDNDKNKNNNKIEENGDNQENDEEDEIIGNLDRNCFYKLKFKNFDITKYEYITNEHENMIKEKNWILNNEEKKRKEKWEEFEEKLKKFKCEKLSNVKELIFDNCSNFLIQWILNFTVGNDNLDFKKSYNDDLELLKFKKCGKDYIDLKNILKMKINNLILFDTPLIIDNFNNDKKSHLNYFKNNLGSINSLTIILNTLDYYNKEYKLNTFKTMEILVELIQCNKFNKNITFGMNALSLIMTFLVYRKYFSKKNLYDNPDILEKGEDLMTKEDITKLENEKKSNNENLTFVSNKFYFCCKKYRDYLINKAFKLNSFEEANITIMNGTIKKQSENFEYFNYLLIKSKKIDKRNREFKKVDFGLNFINIDKDFKQFFSINKISNVTLKNVEFSHSIINSIKAEEGETIINLVSFTEEEKVAMKSNNYPEPKIPDYKMDLKTLKGILFKNFLFEDIGVMFRYFITNIDQSQVGNEKEVKNEEIDKKVIMMEYFKNYIKIFNNFNENIKKLTFIINDMKELKELFCILDFLQVILDKKNWIKEKLISNGKKRDVELPNKLVVDKKIGPYFLKDINEEEEEVYSEFNYYCQNPSEYNILKDKKIQINDYIYYLVCQFDYYI